MGRYPTRQEFQNEAPEAPDIGFGGDSLVDLVLRRFIGDHALGGDGESDEGGETIVADEDGAVLVEEDVGGF